MRFESIVPHGYSETEVDSQRKIRLIAQPVEIISGMRARGMLEDLTQPKYSALRVAFPSTHLIPGALLLEALTELAGMPFLRMPENEGRTGILAGVDKVRFAQEIKPGESVKLEALIVNLHSSFCLVRTRAFLSSGILAARAEILLALDDKPKQSLFWI